MASFTQRTNSFDEVWYTWEGPDANGLYSHILHGIDHHGRHTMSVAESVTEKEFFQRRLKGEVLDGGEGS